MAIVSRDKIRVVRHLYILTGIIFLLTSGRPTRETPDLSSVSRGGPNRSPLTTSHRTRVRFYFYFGCSSSSNSLSAGEKARISAAGGFVDFGRVNGNLALSRALGDFEFKRAADLSPEQQIVTANPDVTTHEVTEDDEFLVIACDGAHHHFPPSLFATANNHCIIL